MTVAGFLTAYALFCLALQITSEIIVVLRLRKPGARRAAAIAVAEPITIIRPVSQRDAFLRATLESTFHLDWPDARIIFCASRESDAAVATVRSLIAQYPDAKARLLIGLDPVSQNPKLNNCVKGWRAAGTDLVALVDSNVMLPRDYVAQMLSAWTPGCGMVTSPPLGARAGSFGAEIECAFLNSHQARWQLLADELGAGFAQGKNLLFRKSILDPLGGIDALAREPAEDAAATKTLSAAGYGIRLATAPFPQPLGRRGLKQVWARQVRWARLRRATFLAIYLPECLAGAALPAAAIAFGAALQGLNVPAVATAYAAVWYGSEFLFALAAGWARSPRAIAAMMVRDALLPIIWIAGLAGNSFEWQGHAMTAKVSENEPKGSVA